MSPGWQDKAAQIASSVEKRIARALPVFRIERFTMVMPTRSASSVNVIRRSCSKSSSLTAIAQMSFGLRAIPVLGLVAIPLNDLVLRRLRAIVQTVRGSDPFVAANADRLQAIAWALLALQLISLVIGGIAEAISTPDNPLHLDAGFSVPGWLAVLLTFVLARVFAEGTRMREDLEGTV